MICKNSLTTAQNGKIKSKKQPLTLGSQDAANETDTTPQTSISTETQPTYDKLDPDVVRERLGMEKLMYTASEKLFSQNLYKAT
jgi:hypothetical protein